MFICLAIQNSLQVNVYRHHCHLAPSPVCTRYSTPLENRIHCLRDFPHSRELWMRMRALAWPGFLHNDFCNLIRLQSKSNNGLRFIAGLWVIWKWRNNMIFEASPWSLEEAWRWMAHKYDELLRFLVAPAGLEDGSGMQRNWVPQAAGIVKLNIDVSFRETQQCMRSGGLLRDDQSRWIFGFHSHHDGGNPLLYEALALKQGLELIWERGYRDVICEIDCQELVTRLEQEEVERFFPILNDIRSLLKRRWRINLAVIGRDNN
ncbi:uncharacterized protein LOC130719872 [Lotus japonicus]|uniref:uncharacterized protein LOC130719872 n=1 Tax=Lotus japonicus TaxID=34305 RepID=UPI00258866CB|nr:uncharacterized protein LOC130719872 [Lotus japonicus]